MTWWKMQAQVLQSSIFRLRGAWELAYSLMVTNKSAQVIITMLTARIAGFNVGGSMKLGMIPGGGIPAGILDKVTWS